MSSNNLFRKVEKSKTKSSSKYETFGFNRNPFPRHPGVIMGDPDDRQNGSIYLRELRIEEERQFEQILIPTDERLESKTIAFLMDYATRKGRGIGKTAFLNYQLGRIMKDLGAELTNNSEVLFAVYVAPIPHDNYRKFSSISKLILTAIIDQEVLSLALCRLRVFSGIIDPKVLNKVGTNTLGETIGNDEWLRMTYQELQKNDPKFDSNIDINALNLSVKRKLQSLNIDINLCNRLSRFGYSSADIYKYYFDEQPDFYWKKKADELLFNDFVKIFDLAGFTHGVILFEELEKVIVPQTSSGRREFCEALRYYLIDGVSSVNTQTSFFKILLTIHPYLQEILYPHWNASGLGRFAGLSEETYRDYTVFFNPIEAPSAVPLAKAYIEKSRLSSSKQTNLTPFTEESLTLALKKALGVPGKFLAFLHSSIERAIDENWDEIGVSEIKSLAFQDAPLEDDDDESGDLGGTKVNLK